MCDVDANSDGVDANSDGVDTSIEESGLADGPSEVDSFEFGLRVKTEFNVMTRFRGEEMRG